MQKKIFLQLFLVLIILTISIIFFKTYFKSEKKNISLKIENYDNKDLSKEIRSNLIYNLKYESKDKIGNSYIIESEVGELNDDEPDLILMKNVVAIIKLNDSTPVTISANNAKYNKITYDTNFYENVIAAYDEHYITSYNLDLIFEKNLATISNNIIYKNLNTKLQADKVEIDLITKNSRIFMYNKSEKINIVSIN